MTLRNNFEILFAYNDNKINMSGNIKFINIYDYFKYFVLFYLLIIISKTNLLFRILM